MDSIGYLGIFVALIGLVVGLLTARGHRRARANASAAQRWRSAPGKVIETGIGVQTGHNSSGGYSYFSPWIRYSYVADGTERTGQRLRFGDVTTRTRGGAETILGRYPAGAEIKVHFDPDAPDESVLEPGKVGNNLRNLAILCAFICLIGVGIFAASLTGVFSADVDGHWRVRFTAGGVPYEGTLDASHRSGPMVLAFTDAEGPHRVREECTMSRSGQHVAVRCLFPVLLEGQGSYSPDDFDLTYRGGSTLTGTMSSNGTIQGTATFTR